MISCWPVPGDGQEEGDVGTELAGAGPLDHTRQEPARQYQDRSVVKSVCRHARTLMSVTRVIVVSPCDISTVPGTAQHRLAHTFSADVVSMCCILYLPM